MAGFASTILVVDEVEVELKATWARISEISEIFGDNWQRAIVNGCLRQDVQVIATALHVFSGGEIDRERLMAGEYSIPIDGATLAISELWRVAFFGPEDPEEPDAATEEAEAENPPGKSLISSFWRRATSWVRAAIGRPSGR